MPGADDPEIPPQDHSKSSPVMWLAGIAAVCTVLVTTLASIPQVPPVVTVIIGAIGAAATGLAGIYTKGLVTPWKDVVAKVTPTGRTIAGPAANAVTPDSMPVQAGDQVEVYKTAA
jgi:hypothetical protein